MLTERPTYAALYQSAAKTRLSRISVARRSADTGMGRSNWFATTVKNEATRFREAFSWTRHTSPPFHQTSARGRIADFPSESCGTAVSLSILSSHCDALSLIIFSDLRRSFGVSAAFEDGSYRRYTTVRFSGTEGPIVPHALSYVKGPELTCACSYCLAPIACSVTQIEECQEVRLAHIGHRAVLAQRLATTQVNYNVSKHFSCLKYPACTQAASYGRKKSRMEECIF